MYDKVNRCLLIDLQYYILFFRCAKAFHLGSDGVYGWTQACEKILSMIVGRSSLCDIRCVINDGDCRIHHQRAGLIAHYTSNLRSVTACPKAPQALIKTPAWMTQSTAEKRRLTRMPPLRRTFVLLRINTLTFVCTESQAKIG
jgi:hypothetical protein